MLKYDEFKNIERRIIKDSINSLDENSIKALIKSLNDLKIDERI